MIKRLLYPVRRCRELFAFAMIKNLIIMVICQIEGLFNDPFLAFLLPIFDSYLICLLAAWLKRFRAAWIVSVIFTLIVTSEVFVIFIYHSLFSISVLQLMVETNASEAIEFLLSSVTNTAPWLAISLSSISWLAAWYVVRVLGNQASKHTKIVTALNVFLVGIIIWSGARQVSAYNKLYKCFTADDCSQLGAPEHRPHLNTPIVRLLHSVAFNIVQSRELPMLQQSISKTHVDSCTHESPLIVLILGESFNKHHTPLYNPVSLPTTPNLCQLQREGSLIAYTDVVTPSNMTSVVLMQMFSTWNTDRTDGWAQHTVFPAVFRKAGYDVAYLSNQFALNGTSDTWASMGGTIFNNQSLSSQQFSWRNDTLVRYDHQLLRLLPEQLVRDTKKPRLVIVHLMGQHVGYEYRFPSEFNHFTVEDIPTSLGGDDGRQIEADYANATLYNDFVVSEVWKRFKDQDAIGIYLSDHGEEVYDWRDFHERSNGSDINAEIARYQFEIPMMFLVSDTYRKAHPDMVSRIQASADRPFISNNMSHLLFHLAGIKTPDYVPERDVLSDRYNTARHRMIGEGTDYDLLMTQ